MDDILPPHEVRRSLRASLFEGVLVAPFTILTSGVFLTAFAFRLGAGEMVLGLLGAAPFLSQIAQAPLSAIVVRARSLRIFTSATALVGRLVWVPLIVLVPLVADVSTRLAIMVGLFALSSLVLTGSQNAWTSWIGEIVPPKRYGRFFGLRNAMVASVSIMTFYVVGRSLDSATRHGVESTIYEVLAMIAIGVSTFGVVALMAQTDRRAATPRHLGLQGWLREPLSFSPMRRLIGTLFVWHFAIGVASPFWAAHMLQVLHLNYTQVAYFSIIASIAGLASPIFWGHLADRFGSRPVFVLCGLSVSLIPLLWLLITPERLWILWFDAVLSGLFWPGIALAVFNLVLSTSRQEGRAYYIGASAAASGLGFAIASVSSGFVAQAISGFRADVLGLHLVHFHLLFAATGVLRGVVAITFLRKLHEHLGTPARYVAFSLLPTPSRIAAFTRSSLASFTLTAGRVAGVIRGQGLEQKDEVE
jgi:MFS-type transporter involved in bile tolerance (Atg22 family)